MIQIGYVFARILRILTGGCSGSVLPPVVDEEHQRDLEGIVRDVVAERSRGSVSLKKGRYITAEAKERFREENQSVSSDENETTRRDRLRQERSNERKATRLSVEDSLRARGLDPAKYRVEDWEFDAEVGNTHFLSAAEEGLSENDLG
jgi:hypothetical protein